MPSCVVPPLPGVTPPTIFVPYSTICFAWNVPSFPVSPCTIRRVDLSTRTLNDQCSSFSISDWQCRLHQLDVFTILRHVHVPAQLLLDVFGHRRGRFRFAMRQKSCARRTDLHSLQPAQHLGPVSMRREAANLRDATTHRHPLSHDFYFRLAVKDATSGRAG